MTALNNVQLRKPTVFLASSSERSRYVDALVVSLGESVHSRPWPFERFALGGSTMDGIDSALSEADFVVVVLGPDDRTISRAVEAGTTRDNAILELGMAIGRVGRDRTFFVFPAHSPDFKLPSDLLGIVGLTYDEAVAPEHAVTVAAARIREAVRSLGPLPGTPDDSRGDTAHIHAVADAAVSVAESRRDYAKELKRRLLSGEIVPSKYQYALPRGADYWLRLCESDAYKFHKRSMALLRRSGRSLVEAICASVGSSELDFVSLGCGDGRKDSLLLGHVFETAKADERARSDRYTYYYPVDISDVLVVEAVRRVFGQHIEVESARCKPILGDFADARTVSAVVGHRPAPNVFSILGNTFGNADELALVRTLELTMRAGDLALLEVNTAPVEDSLPLLSGGDAWDLNTLDEAGIAHGPSDCTFEHLREEASAVPGARSLVSYAVPTTGEYAGRRLPLSALHHYDVDRLVEWLTDRLELSLVTREEDDCGVALLLLRRD